MPAFSSRAPGALENNDKEKLKRFSNEISPGWLCYDRFRAPLLFAVDPCVSIHGFISMDAVSLDSSLFENKL